MIHPRRQLLPVAAIAAGTVYLPACDPMPPAAPNQTPERSAAPAWSMQAYAWSHRPVVIFALDPADPALATQRQTLIALAPSLAEREIVVIQAVADSVTADDEPVAASPADLRAAYDVPTDQPFAALLVGKDTGVKLRSAAPLTEQDLFPLIDSMPMRQREMSR
ncbi:MAG: DUF4174 domain-containing protein [Planctomycetota bacterium]